MQLSRVDERGLLFSKFKAFALSVGSSVQPLFIASQKPQKIDAIRITSLEQVPSSIKGDQYELFRFALKNNDSAKAKPTMLSPVPKIINDPTALAPEIRPSPQFQHVLIEDVAENMTGDILYVLYISSTPVISSSIEYYLIQRGRRHCWRSSCFRAAKFEPVLDWRCNFIAGARACPADNACTTRDGACHVDHHLVRICIFGCFRFELLPLLTVLLRRLEIPETLSGTVPPTSPRAAEEDEYLASPPAPEQNKKKRKAAAQLSEPDAPTRKRLCRQDPQLDNLDSPLPTIQVAAREVFVSTSKN